MGIKSLAAKWLAKKAYRETLRWTGKPIETQQKVFQTLIKTASNTAFGQDHDFASIKNYDDFRARVLVRDYEQLKGYIDRILKGEQDILWPGKPLYLAKTSGTTSGVKYIPISKASMPYHIIAARNALLSYIYYSGNAKFVAGKMIFLSGSPELDEKAGIPTGRLSGIVNHHVPAYLQRNKMPSYKTNCIEEWEKKLERIIDETIQADMSLISGIPPWVQMYFDRLTERTGKKVGEIFPNFSVLVHGGVNFEPYKDKLMKSIGRDVAAIETFPASEGFFAYQDKQDEEGLLLLLNGGIFYEFIPVSDAFSDNPKRLSIEEVELGENYLMILNTNAGLWGYNLGDTVKFVSKNPYKVVVTGRIKHFISAFGEHVIAEEVEQSITETAREEGAEIREFTVAPQVNPPEGGTPYHEWFIEFEKVPASLDNFTRKLNNKLVDKNIYYKDLIDGNILQPLKIRPLPEGTFLNYMRKSGKLGGQNKVVRLSNDRKIADILASELK